MASRIELVGRDQELAELDALLEERTATALLLEGEPGIGKTTVWLHGLARARDHGHRVLEARPGASESELGFSALADLLAGQLEDVLPRLPDPQRRALETALLLVDAEGPPPDQRAIGTAVLNVLRGFAAERPLVLAVDDVQWLDAASAAALSFAARRLREESVTLVLTRRSRADEPAPLDLDAALAPKRLHRRRLEPLSLGGLHHLLRTRLEHAYPRPTLRRIHRTSGGNPFYALELARALERRGLDAEAAIPIPDSLDELIREQIEALPHGVRGVLVLAAAHDDPTITLLSSASDGDARPAIAAATGAGVVEVEGERVRFSHPLFAAALYDWAGSTGRLEAHRRLAALASSSEERARHASLAAEAPDADLAASVEAGAAEALTRGAPASAGELLERAARVTPQGADVDRRRRIVQAAKAHFQAGTTVRSLELLEPLPQTMEAGRDRAEVLELLSRVKAELAGPQVGYELMGHALAESGADDVLTVRLLADRARWALFAGQAATGVLEGKRAVELAEGLDDPELLAYALAGLLFASHYAGVPVDRAIVERALEFERRSPRLDVEASPSLIHIERLTAELDLQGARKVAERLRARALEHGDDSLATEPLFRLVSAELLAGDWQNADRHADELVELAEQTGVNVAYAAAVRAHVDAHLGRVDRARAAALNEIERAAHAGQPVIELWALLTLGFVDLSLGDAAAAAGWFERWDEVSRSIGLGEAFSRRQIVNYAEALVALGRVAEAREVLEGYRDRIAATGRSWIYALTRRVDGMIAAADGDLVGALAQLEAGAGDEVLQRLPFERARTLLALGKIQRRAKRRRDARATLGEAQAIFEELGARLWAERARAELARIGGRQASGAELTATEQKLADLVAEGLSNKEIAAALFVTPKTVGTKLSRIYAKVGVHSRTELVRRLGERASKV
jgi:DNA-binding CsgD family transcriptional regulator/DNA polymerase III delta prime subunit